MSTEEEIIRQAVALMRSQQGEFWDAVADLLENSADAHARHDVTFDTERYQYRSCTIPDRLVVNIARTYVGGEQP